MIFVSSRSSTSSDRPRVIEIGFNRVSATLESEAAGAMVSFEVAVCVQQISILVKLDSAKAFISLYKSQMLLLEYISLPYCHLTYAEATSLKFVHVFYYRWVHSKGTFSWVFWPFISNEKFSTDFCSPASSQQTSSASFILS